jgi:hypothetical protein
VHDGDFLACPRSGYGISRFNAGKLLAEGNSNKDVANRLNLSLHTMETHRWRIMEKMDLHKHCGVGVERGAPQHGDVIALRFGFAFERTIHNAQLVSLNLN